jgi:hypothetical protein
MSAEPQKLRRKAAKRPQPRTVTVTGKGDFAEWEVTARADFPASYIEDLMSGSVDRIIKVFDAIVIDHNLPNSDDQIAERMADVDPWQGLVEIAGDVFDAIAKLPNR